MAMGGDLQPGCLADRLLTSLGPPQMSESTSSGVIFFFFWWGLHGPQQGPDRMKEKTYKTGKRKTPA